MPLDPFDGRGLGYDRTLRGYVLWSTGPDQQSYTHDDLVQHFELATNNARTATAR